MVDLLTLLSAFLPIDHSHAVIVSLLLTLLSAFLPIYHSQALFDSVLFLLNPHTECTGSQHSELLEKVMRHVVAKGFSPFAFRFLIIHLQNIQDEQVLVIFVLLLVRLKAGRHFYRVLNLYLSTLHRTAA